MKDYLKTTAIIVLIAALAYYIGSCNSTTREIEVVKTDTVYVDEVYTDTVVIHHYAKPKTITVYSKPDTARRQAMEQRTIIQGLRIEPKGVEVATIDTNGFTRVAYYPTPIGSTVLVADTGAVEVTPISNKKANLRKAGRIAVVVLSVVVGGLIF